MILYLDASVVLRVLLNEPERLKQWGRWKDAYTSELTGVEARRVIDRMRLSGELTDEQVAMAQELLSRIEAGLSIVDLNKPILERASMPMATVLRTLDAMHIATAIALREKRAPDVVFATHDQQQSTAARAMRFSCVGM